MRKIYPFIFIVLSAIALISCQSNVVYNEYNQVDAQGWNYQTGYVFKIPIVDTTAKYNILVNVRTEENYPYQNLWLFLNETSPEKILSKDTIECYLADEYGRWLGKGLGGVKEMTILYQRNIKFSKSGEYKYKIVHGMRDSILSGIREIGLKIEKIP